MPGFGFGKIRRSRAMTRGAFAGAPMVLTETYGALSRSQYGAGMPTGATAILAGDANGHWTIANGRLFPSALGDSADLNAGPYSLQLNNGDLFQITIEPETWDVTDQSEWSVVATQSPATLQGKTIALRNAAPLNLGITGAFGTPFRINTYQDVAGNPCVIKGRFGAQGEWADYCEVENFGTMRGAVGVRFQHLRTTASAETKINVISVSANHSDNITYDDCWITGEPVDPNDAALATSTNNPMLGIDLVTTAGKSAPQGSITITNCLLEFADTICTISVDKPGSTFTFSDNEVRYYFGDGVQAHPGGGNAPQAFVCHRNFIHGCVGRPSDTVNSHPDAIRVQGSTTAANDFPFDIQDNVILPGNARGESQGIYMDDMKSGGTDSGHFFTGTVRNNLVQVKGTRHGLDIGQAKNCLVEYNTFVGNNTDNTQIVSVGISGGASGTDGGGNVTQKNIAERFNVQSGTSTANHELGLNGVTISYDSVFAGPTWQPTTITDALSWFNPEVDAGASGSVNSA